MKFLLLVIALGASLGEGEVAVQGLTDVTVTAPPAIFTWRVPSTEPGIDWRREVAACSYNWLRWNWIEDYVRAECRDEDWVECPVDPGLLQDPSFFPINVVALSDAWGQYTVRGVQCTGPWARVSFFKSSFEKG